MQKISSNSSDSEGSEKVLHMPLKRSGCSSNRNESLHLAMWNLGQCDARRCSGLKLVRQKKLQLLRLKQGFPGVVLTPTAQRFLSPNDRDIVERQGLAVVDCSWNEIENINWKKIKMGHPRVLPFLVTANPTHYGQSSEMNCAEAIAAALYILGFEEKAHTVLSSFNWGEEFFRLNAELLDRYIRCNDESDIEKVQSDWIALLDCERETRARRAVADESTQQSAFGLDTYVPFDDLSSSES